MSPENKNAVSERIYIPNEIDLSGLLSNLPGMAYRCRNDQRWTMEFVSQGCFELTGYRHEDILNNKNLSYGDLIDAEDRQRVWMVIQAALLHKQTFRLVYKINTASDEEKWVWEQGIGIYAEDGSVEALEGFVTDITHKKSAEKQLLDSEMRFRKIFEYAPIGIAMSGSDFHFIKANSAFCEMLGYSQQELKSLTFKDITHPEHLAVDTNAINSLLTGQIKHYQTEKRYIRKNGTVRWGTLTVSTVCDAQGKFLYFLCMINDITERKLAELELTRINQKLTDQNRIQNEFMSTVTHELRTPLCVFKNIISNTIAGVNGPISPKLRKSLEMANQNVDRLSRIVNDFLDIARIEAGKMKLVKAQTNVTAVITEIVEAFTSVVISKQAVIDKISPQDDIFIEADRDKLIQVLTNLVGNACKFIRIKGHILITLTEQAENIFISVHDDGPGIEPEKLTKLFNRFEIGAEATRDGQPSTGLGLAISKELIELHNGQIYAESVAGLGSTFTVRLPKKQNESFCLIPFSK